jgi:hypothetical protein
MRLEMPPRVDWEVPPVLADGALQEILHQPFSYLDRGAQCYVFQSSDQQYVLKLFRYDQPHFVHRTEKASALEKREKLFAACLLAYHKAREETGLVYLHLNQTDSQLPILQAKGPMGQMLRLPLDQYRFAIQKKAEPFRAALLAAYHAPDTGAFPKLLDSFVSVLSSRLSKGIGNSDPTVARNFGFLQGRAVEIDFGNYYAGPVNPIEQMHRYTHRLRRWLQHQAPEWVPYFDEQVSRCETLLL